MIHYVLMVVCMKKGSKLERKKKRMAGRTMDDRPPSDQWRAKHRVPWVIWHNMLNP